MGNKPQQANTSDVIKVRYEKLQALREAGRDPFVITTSDRDVYTKTVKDKFEDYENKDVCVAGRIMSKRGKGKVSFLDLHDKTGKIQIFAKFDDLGEEEYGFLKKWDIGDIVERRYRRGQGLCVQDPDGRDFGSRKGCAPALKVAQAAA